MSLLSDVERPEIRVRVVPEKIRQGDLLQIQASLVDPETERPITIQSIFMRILNSEGLEIYPTQNIARNQAGFIINISTTELAPGDYALQVSNNTNFSPIGVDNFTVKEKSDDTIIPVAFLPAITFPSTKGGYVPPVENQIITTVRPIVPLLPPARRAIPGVPPVGIIPEAIRFISLWQFNTEEDDRVCPYCEPLNLKVYEEDDPEMPDIPLHRNCRCWFTLVTDEAPAEGSTSTGAVYVDVGALARVQEVAEIISAIDQ